MNYSFWEKYFIESPAQVTIIGAGIVGLSTAISIAERNMDLTIKVLDRGHLSYGASTKNAGFSCFGSVSEILDDMQANGEEMCMDIVKMRWQGLSKLKERVHPEIMEYQACGGIEFFKKTDVETIEVCTQAIPHLNELMEGYLSIKNCYQSKPNTTLSAFDSTTIFNPYEGTINPVKMMQELYKKAISLGITIIFGIEINDIRMDDHLLITKDNLHINYQKLILCTNGFTQRIMPELAVFPARNQVLMTLPLANNPLAAACHYDKGYIYFRQYKNRILIGGGRNLDLDGEMTDNFGLTDKIQHYLLDILDSIYPGASTQIDHWWSGIMGVGPSKYPIIKWLDDSVLAGVRLGGMGVAIGSYLGEQLAEEVTNL
ncbi:MAG: FAD-binding oxidoreductase [Saprospiraceae bacterium]|nr:MAG: FAD-dependent oxidoreductase [Bacteroidetes bacterium OLB9]MCO6462640.1 FAD-binding oxidoreductase [Saprospiraceae bacterium]MCZ2336795.1 FAD-binding oxidoreductase [Chitinophagales bacterium]